MSSRALHLDKWTSSHQYHMAPRQIAFVRRLRPSTCNTWSLCPTTELRRPPRRSFRPKLSASPVTVLVAQASYLSPD